MIMLPTWKVVKVVSDAQVVCQVVIVVHVPAQVVKDVVVEVIVVHQVAVAVSVNAEQTILIIQENSIVIQEVKKRKIYFKYLLLLFVFEGLETFSFSN